MNGNLHDDLPAGQEWVQVTKGEYLLRAGERSRYSFHVQKGLLRAFTVDEKGKEHVYMFAPEGWIVGDVAAHVFDRVAELNVIANEDSEVIKVMTPSMAENEPNDDAMSALPPEEIIKLARRVGRLQDRINMLLSASAAERYEHFLEMYPEISHRVPLKQIASYLGMTPEALSKVRRERVQSKS